MNNHFSTKNINIDLHIHSSASRYKDGVVVDNSTKENVGVLIKGLEEKNINLFAITDHNRFDYLLYQTLKEEVVKSSVIEHVLPGIEFDVTLEEGYPSCHIIAIFDDSRQELLEVISDKIKAIKELKEDESYSKDEFERLIRYIGLKTILIVHQKQSLDNARKGTHSLSGSCDDPSYFIKTGYVDCLEFGTNRQEGIIKASLRDIKVCFPLITGSDCHEWSAYPYRSSRSSKIERRFTSLKCLPTFKGLLMAVTSFETRANRNTNSNRHFISSVSIGSNRYPLSNGINAIVGDNGSGKTLLLNLLCGGNKRIYDKIVSHNNMSLDYNDNSFSKESILYIEQGKINQDVLNGKLFGNDSDYYLPITTLSVFNNQISDYFNKLNAFVNANINLYEKKNEFEKETIIIEAVDKSFYYPVIEYTIDQEDTSKDKERFSKLKEYKEQLKTEYQNNLDYYTDLGVSGEFEKTIDGLEHIFHIVESVLSKKEKRNKAKGIISSKLRHYSIELQSKRTGDEEERKTTMESYRNFVQKLIDLLKIEKAKNQFPDFPKPIEGRSSNVKGGFVFSKTAKYDGLFLKDDFYKQCFNSEYNSEERIKAINTKDKYKAALKGCTSLDDINKYRQNKIGGFINDWSAESTFVSEVSTNESIGNTPGENALVYYKYTISEKNDAFNVLAIDQPEDDINPKRINDYLLNYLGSIRDKKQVIIVTHNPLLVVNLDVDNVIYLKKENNDIFIKYGALEYDGDYNMLDFVKDNLDGGYTAIEGRLKKYEKDND